MPTFSRLSNLSLTFDPSFAGYPVVITDIDSQPVYLFTKAVGFNRISDSGITKLDSTGRLDVWTQEQANLRVTVYSNNGEVMEHLEGVSTVGIADVNLESASSTAVLSSFSRNIVPISQLLALANNTEPGSSPYIDFSIFATAAQGAKADTALQPGIIPTGTTLSYSQVTGLGSAATSETYHFASSLQGAKADTALQPGALPAGTTLLTSQVVGLDTAALKPLSFFATASQGLKADTALQPGLQPSSVTVSLSQVVGAGSAAARSALEFATSSQGAKADTALQPGMLPPNTYINVSNVYGLGTSAFYSASTFATAAQGAKADTALQPGPLPSTVSINASQVIGYVGNGSGSVDVSQFATAAQGLKADTALQPGIIPVGTTIPAVQVTGLGTAALQSTANFATSSQGAKADTALQPGVIPSGTSIPYTQVTGLGTSATYPYTAFATATQGTKADLALQPGILPIGTTIPASQVTGLGTAALQNVGYFATSVQGLKADTALQPGVLPTGTTIPYSQVTGLGTSVTYPVGYFATSVQGTKADTSLQPTANVTQTALTNATSFGVSLIQSASASTLRPLLELGNSAVLNTNVPGGVVTLDGSYRIPSQYIPDIAITTFLGNVATEAAMLALVGQVGDWCIRSDISKVFIVTGVNSTLLSSWTALEYPTSSSEVLSVAGRVGNVTLSYTDISGLGNIATHNTSEFATATQGAKADTALQPGILPVGTTIPGNQVTSTVATASSASIVTTSAQPLITSVGTLTSLTSSGDVSITSTTASTSAITGALKVAGGVGVTGRVTAGSFYGNGAGLTGLNYSQISGFGDIVTHNISEFATAAQGAKADTALQPGTTLPNDVYINSSQIIGLVSAVDHATTAGTVTSNVQSAIQEIGILNFLDIGGILSVLDTTPSTSKITGSATFAGGIGVAGDIYTTNLYATNSVNAATVVATLFTGSGAGLNNIPASSIVGTVSQATAATTAGTVTTAAQPNITSLGNLTSLNVTGPTSIADITQSTSTITGALKVSGGVGVVGNLYIGGTISGNGSGLTNIPSGSIVGTVPQSTSAVNADTVILPTQTNITTLGTLTGLTSSGAISILSNTSSTSTTTGALKVSGGVGVAGNLNVGGTISGNGAGITNIPGSAITSSVPSASFATAAGSTIAAVTAETVTSAAQPNITSLGTLTGLLSSGDVSITATTASTSTATGALKVSGGVGVAGNISALSFSGDGSNITSIAGSNVNGAVANATNAVNATHSITAGTVTTAAQPNITSVGQLLALGVAGDIGVGGDVYATTFYGDGSHLTGLASNTSTTAETVTNPAQPAITSVGILTSLESSGSITAANFIGSGSSLTGILSTQISDLGNIATHNTSEFATSVQGAKADTALQPGILPVGTTIPIAQVSGTGDIVTHNVSEFATASQGAKADTALQPSTNLTQTAVNNITSFGSSLLQVADAAASRTLQGLGSASLLSTNISGGVPVLDGSAKIPSAFIPDIAITTFLGTVADEPTMLALLGQLGDWCIRSDMAKVFIITGADPTLLSDWTALSYPASTGSSTVTSVAGRIGDVVLSYTDVGGLGNIVTHNISEFATSAQGTKADTALQPGVLPAGTTIPIAQVSGTGDIVTHNTSEFATSAQGSLATSALQPGVLPAGTTIPIAQVSGTGDVVTHNISEFATASQGSKADTALQPGILPVGTTIPITQISGTGDIVTHNISEFATSAQGTKADTALQPGVLPAGTTIPIAQVSGTGDIVTHNISEFATSAQGSLATSALQPGILPVGTTIPIAQVSGTGDIVTHNVSEFATTSQGAKADTALQPSTNLTQTDIENISIFGSSLIKNADSAAARTSLGLGSASLLNTNMAGGLPILDGSSKIPVEYIPDIAITTFLGTVANESAMLALIGQLGDWVIRSDVSKVFVITGTDPSLVVNWTSLQYPISAGAVTSVAGRTGDITLSTADIGGLGDIVTHAVTEFATSSQGAKADTALQPGLLPAGTTIPIAQVLGTGDIVTHNTSEFATAVQGAKADTALQPGVLPAGTTIPIAQVSGTGDIVTHNISEFATSAQGTKADTALQPGVLPAGTTIPIAQVSGTGDIVTHNTSEFATTSQGAKADTALQPGVLPVGTTIPGNQVTSTVATATTAGTVTTAAQPNITSVGTLTSITSSGNVSITATTASTSIATGALKVSGGVGIAGNLYVGGILNGNGSGLTGIPGSSITSAVANATVAVTAGTVTAAAQPNITSLGTLTSLTSTGTITANSFSGNGSALTNLSGSAVVGNVYSCTVATMATTATGAAQPNITSIGTAGTTLTILGNASPTTNANGALRVTGGITTQDGVVSTRGYSVTSTATHSIDYPEGASYTYVAGSSVTGAIVINLPVLFNSSMISISLSVQEYTKASSYEFRIAGYLHTASSAWLGANVYGIANSKTAYTTYGTAPEVQIPIRLGHNGTNSCIIIGDVGYIWQYPNVVVNSITTYYSNFNFYNWNTGWTSTIVTSLAAYTISSTFTTPIENRPISINTAPLTGRNSPKAGIYTYNTVNSSLGNTTPTGYWSTIGFGNGTSGSAELSCNWTANGNQLWFRSLRDSTDNWYAWKEILHSGNYTSYTVATDGTGATGTWPINVTGRYMPFTNNTYYFDDHNGSKFFRTYIYSSRYTISRFQTVSTVEYYDYGTTSWTDWSAQLTNIGYLLNGQYSNTVSIDHTHRTFRFYFQAASVWPSNTLIVLDTTWSAITYPGCVVTVEQSASAGTAGPWTVVATLDFSYANGVTTWGLAAFYATTLHTANGYYRITISYNDWTDSTTYTTIPMRGFEILSNYAGRSKDPTSYSNSGLVYLPSGSGVISSSSNAANNLSIYNGNTGTSADARLTVSNLSYYAALILRGTGFSSTPSRAILTVAAGASSQLDTQLNGTTYIASAVAGTTFSHPVTASSGLILGGTNSITYTTGAGIGAAASVSAGGTVTLASIVGTLVISTGAALTAGSSFVVTQNNTYASNSYGSTSTSIISFTHSVADSGGLLDGTSTFLITPKLVSGGIKWYIYCLGAKALDDIIKINFEVRKIVTT